MCVCKSQIPNTLNSIFILHSFSSLNQDIEMACVPQIIIIIMYWRYVVAEYIVIGKPVAVVSYALLLQLLYTNKQNIIYIVGRTMHASGQAMKKSRNVRRVAVILSFRCWFSPFLFCVVVVVV